MDCIGPEAVYDRRSITAKALEIQLVHLGYSGVIAGPAEYGVSERFYLSPPDPVVLADSDRPHHEDVDVTVDVTVAPRRRAEDGDVDRKWLPVLECLS